ncbi:hypothetical protein Tco_0340048 [Tanacetum coccineum]
MEISTSSSKERRAATDATARKTKRLPCLTRLKMFHNLDQLRLQLERENLHGVNAKTCLQALRTQFKEFLAQKEPENNDAFSKPESETHMQRQEEKVNMREAVDAGLVVTESSGTNPDKQNTSSIQGVIPHKLWMQYQTSKLTKKHLLSHSHYLPKVIESALQHSSGECPDYQGIVITNRMVISTSDVHKRPESPCHLPGDDFLLGNLKFISKGETNEVFGMTIPKQLITQAIQQSLYYPKYLEMVAKNTKKTPQDSASKQPEPATKRAPPKKPTTTTPVKPTKTPSSKQPKSPTKKPSKRKLPQKVRKGKPSFQLVDEDDEAQQESVPQEEGDDPDLELAKKMSLDAHQEKGEGEGADADIERAIKLSLDPAFLPQGRAPVGGVTIRDPVSETTTKLPEVVGKGKAIVTEEQVATDQFILVRRDQAPHDSTTGPSSQPEDDTSEKVIHESSSTSDSERTESETEAAAPKGDKELGEVDSSTVSSGVSIPVSAQGQAGSDPEKAHEALAGPDPEPMQEDQTGSNSGKLHVSLAGPNPEHMDDEFLATAYPKVHENLKLITDERVIEDNPESHSGSMSSMKNLEDTDNFGDQFLYDKPIEDDQEKSKVVDESDSTIPDPSHQAVTSTPPVIAPVTDFSSPKPSSLVTPPPINTEATTITTSLPEITPFIALQLRVARLEQEMSEVKKTDHSADVLASIKSQVPTVVDKYLGTKLDDALLRILERHTADLIEKYSVLPGPESIKNQESEKSQKEIIKIKKEQGEEKQESTYSIRTTDKVTLEEFDLKSALFKHMNKNKTTNRNPANYHLYHALMEALIADEDAMDKEVKDRVKDHKRKHDSDDDEDDDDDEGPSAGSNQGKSAKRRRHDSGASGSAQPPTKDDEQSSKKPRESDASASKQHPALTSTGWQITDTRDAVVDSSMHRSDPESEHSEQSTVWYCFLRFLYCVKEEASKKKSKNNLELEAPNKGTVNILGFLMISKVFLEAFSEGTDPSQGPAPSVMTPDTSSSGIGKFRVHQQPYVSSHANKDYES